MLEWSGFKPIVIFFRFSPLKCLLNYVNIFQIMYLIIGVYNTKTEPEKGKKDTIGINPLHISTVVIAQLFKNSCS